MEQIRPAVLPMHTLLLCSDVQFLGTTRGVLRQLQVTPKVVDGCQAALDLIHAHKFEVIVADWREIDNLGDFICGVRRSKLNADCILVAIVRDLLDLRQAFAAGVHFLIHKPASVVQIERCLRAAYCATIARRRKQHREPVQILASVSSHSRAYAEAVIVNLSEGGAGLKLSTGPDAPVAHLSAGEEVDLQFSLPETGETLHASGTVLWSTASHCGMRFTHVPLEEKLALEQWLTGCVERSLAELCERLGQVCA